MGSGGKYKLGVRYVSMYGLSNTTGIHYWMTLLLSVILPNTLYLITVIVHLQC